MKESIFYLQLVLILGLFYLVRADGNVSHPLHGVILVIDQHTLSEPELHSTTKGEVIIDASGPVHPTAQMEQASHDLPEHWTLLTSPATFHAWLNASTFYPSELRRFEWRADPLIFPDWAVTNRSVIQWRLTEDSSFQSSSLLLLNTFSHGALSRVGEHLFGPSFDIRLIPSWAYFLIRRADLLSSEQSYQRIRSLIKLAETHPSISEVVDDLWDDHGVWIGYRHDLTPKNPYPLQPHLSNITESDISHLSHSEIAQILFSFRFGDVLQSQLRTIPSSYLQSILRDFPELVEADLWRALSPQEKFNSILKLVEKFAARPPPRFRQFATVCWLNPDLDGLLTPVASYFDHNPLAFRVFCWLLSSSATGLPQFIPDWLFTQNLTRFQPAINE